MGPLDWLKRFFYLLEEEEAQMDLEMNVGQGVIKMLEKGPSSANLNRVQWILNSSGVYTREAMEAIYVTAAAIAFNGGSIDGYLSRLGDQLNEDKEHLICKPTQKISEYIIKVMRSYLENMVVPKMRINGIDRIVSMSEPTKDYSGKYLVNAQHPFPVQQLDMGKFIWVLYDKGLQYSQTKVDVRYGFNDFRLFDPEEAKEVMKGRLSTIWIGLNPDSVDLEITPFVVAKLLTNTRDYANGVLDTVVAFVENENNYVL